MPRSQQTTAVKARLQELSDEWFFLWNNQADTDEEIDAQHDRMNAIVNLVTKARAKGFTDVAIKLRLYTELAFNCCPGPVEETLMKSTLKDVDRLASGTGKDDRERLPLRRRRGKSTAS